jgi:malate synthase
MRAPFLASYVEWLVATCHHRGAHAMGGMAAQIPIRNDPQANEAAMARVREDKLREVWARHDGTWVAHPGLVPLAKSIFDTHMPYANQLCWQVTSNVTAPKLLQVPQGTITPSGLARNLDVGLQYLAAWLGGNGCVPIYNLMEDAATAEICRAQVWQWVRHGATLDDGRRVTLPLVRGLLSEQAGRLAGQYGGHDIELAERLYDEMIAKPDFTEFLTVRAYEYLD